MMYTRILDSLQTCICACIFLKCDLIRLLLKPGPEPWKTWTLKNMDPGKHGIYMGLKNISDFRELFLTKSTFLLIKYSVPTILIEWTNVFRDKSLNVKV